MYLCNFDAFLWLKMQNIWLTKLVLGQVVFLNWFWDHYTSHPSNLHITGNATRCINCDDRLPFSFTLKIYFKIYEDLWRSMMELNCENNKQKNSIVDARSGSSNVLLFLKYFSLQDSWNLLNLIIFFKVLYLF